jgi:cytidine kinase
MSLLVTGSIGIDTVESPAGKVVDALGGSSIYFAYAASFFTPVRLVGVVGDDCPPDFLTPLHDNANIDLGGLEVRAGSKTFRWHGKYREDINERDTVSVDLNVLGEAGPTIPHAFCDSDFVFLANTHPDLQIELLGQLHEPKFVACDTMDLWIDTERDSLMKLLAKVDAVILNDAEARQLTGETNVVKAGLALGEILKQYVIIKKGEHGALLFADGQVSVAIGYPAGEVVDPTGAGDSFAGGLMGYLAAQDATSVTAVRKAMGYGAAVASLELEDFSLNRLIALSREDIDARLDEIAAMTGFEG